MHARMKTLRERNDVMAELSCSLAAVSTMSVLKKRRNMDPAGARGWEVGKGQDHGQ